MAIRKGTFLLCLDLLIQSFKFKDDAVGGKETYPKFVCKDDWRCLSVLLPSFLPPFPSSLPPFLFPSSLFLLLQKKEGINSLSYTCQEYCQNGISSSVWPVILTGTVY